MGQKQVPTVEEELVYESVPLSAEDKQKAEVGHPLARKASINPCLGTPTSVIAGPRCTPKHSKHTKNSNKTSVCLSLFRNSFRERVEAACLRAGGNARLLL